MISIKKIPGKNSININTHSETGETSDNSKQNCVYTKGFLCKKKKVNKEISRLNYNMYTEDKKCTNASIGMSIEDIITFQQ
jgi:hypothetical protein